MTPKVSVVIPVYNGANYLAQAIDSALSQSYPNLEVIVVNDGSSDGGATEKIALSYGQRIKYICQNNKGTGGALNTGIKAMSGDYFSWLSHDDLYTVDKVSAQIDELERLNNKDAVIFSHFMVIDSDGREVQTVFMPPIIPDKLFLFLYTNRLIHGCSLLVPKQAFEKVGLFNENLKTTQDYDLWLSMCRQIPFHLCDKVLVKGRQHAQQSSNSSADSHQEKDAFYQKYMPFISLDELRKCLASSNWPQFVADVSLAMIKQNCNQSLLKWLIHISRISQELDLRTQEALTGAVLMVVVHSDIKNIKAYLAPLFR